MSCGYHRCLAVYVVVLLGMLLPSGVHTAANFTQEPPSKLYVPKGGTARFVWDYQLDRGTKLDSSSPAWYFFEGSTSRKIAYIDMYDGYRWTIDKTSCPARLRIPTVRVSLESGSKSTMVITNVTTADSGFYRCLLTLSISSGGLNVWSNRVQLIAVVNSGARFTQEPPSKLYVLKGGTARFVWDYQLDGGTKHDSSSPAWYLLEGNTSKRIAYIDKYDGWKIDTNSCPARLRTPTVRVSLESGSKATLVITNVTTADSGFYGCILGLNVSSGGSQILSNKVHVLATATPTFIARPNQLSPIRENLSLNISCAAVGPPTPNVTWVQVQAVAKVTKVQGVGSATLSILNIKREQNGTVYECQAVNNPNQGPVTTQTVVVVYYKPTINKTLSTNDVDSWNKNTVTLTCLASSGNPSPTFTWYKPNGDVLPCNRCSKTVRSHVIVKTGQDCGDYGLYRCIATNVIGSDQHSINVTQLCSVLISMLAAFLVLSLLFNVFLVLYIWRKVNKGSNSQSRKNTNTPCYENQVEMDIASLSAETSIDPPSNQLSAEYANVSSSDVQSPQHPADYEIPEIPDYITVIQDPVEDNPDITMSQGQSFYQPLTSQDPIHYQQLDTTTKTSPKDTSTGMPYEPLRSSPIDINTPPRDTYEPLRNRRADSRA